MNNVTWFARIIVIMLIIFCGPLITGAGELRPFVLPSTEDARQARPQDQYQRPPQEPSVYREFAQQVKNMNAEQKEQAKAHYRQSYNQAAQEGNQIEMNYYNDLLNILNQN